MAYLFTNGVRKSQPEEATGIAIKEGTALSAFRHLWKRHGATMRCSRCRVQISMMHNNGQVGPCKGE